MDLHLLPQEQRKAVIREPSGSCCKGNMGKSSSSSSSTNMSKGKNKNKKKPIKVVYISNPRRVEASVSEFRGLVQELTGRDAVLSDDPVESPTAETNWADSSGKQAMASDGQVYGEEGETPAAVATETSDISFEALEEDVFMPFMMDNYAASYVYEAAKIGGLRSL